MNAFLSRRGLLAVALSAASAVPAIVATAAPASLRAPANPPAKSASPATATPAAAPTSTPTASDPTDAIDEIVAQFFRPFQLDHPTLAPDGRHLAMIEQVRGGPAAVVVVTIDDRSVQRHIVASTAEHAVQQLRWVSPTRLVFTTRGRAVGAIDVPTGKVSVLLLARDLDSYIPEPTLGYRSPNAIATPDMPADALATHPGEFGPRQEMTVREALAQGRVTGDLFGSDSSRDTGRALRPFLLGPKPGSPDTVLVELRGDGDLYAYRRADRKRVTVPGNIYLVERHAPVPNSVDDLSDQRSLPGSYASYDIDRLPPPLVVLELDTVKGRTRELATEDTWRRVWLDHQGRLRIVLEQQGRSYRYLYRGADSRKWVPLESIARTGEPLGFTIEPASLLAPRSVPLGFDSAGKSLLLATNVGRDTYRLRALNLAKGRFEEFEAGNDRHDLIEATTLATGDVLRFDPHTNLLAGIDYAAARRDTRWFNPAMNALQDRLSQQLAPQRCELREWTADHKRFLIEASSSSDPGSFYIFETEAGKLILCGTRAPWLTEQRRNPTRDFDFVTDDGRRLAGCLTFPRQPRLDPPPVLVYFHDGPWFSDPPVFNRGAQALASLGFAVLQLNHRGSSGLGRKHLTAIDGGLDRAVLADVLALLERGKSGRLAINTRMVATFGNGIGGYLAVRMAQLAPETFRCAVAINAPGDLDAWRTHPDTAPSILADLRAHVFGTDRETLRTQSALAVAETTKAPVLVVHGTHNSYVPVSLGRDLYRALKKGSDETAYLELPNEGHGGWSEQTTAKLFAELGRFFNATIYNYKVDIRQPEVVKK